jgi:hypothetical protein
MSSPQRINWWSYHRPCPWKLLIHQNKQMSFHTSDNLGFSIKNNKWLWSILAIFANINWQDYLLLVQSNLLIVYQLCSIYSSTSFYNSYCLSTDHTLQQTFQLKLCVQTDKKTTTLKFVKTAYVMTYTNRQKFHLLHVEKRIQ